MKLSLRSEYALLTLIQLSRQNDGETLPPEAIATAQHIPSESLAEILSVLDSSGYATWSSIDGRVRLAKSAEKISVAEIIRLFDGALAPLEPVSAKGYAPAPMDKEEKLAGLFEQIHEQISERLEGTTIAELT
jgi:Rrf2 family transcriptional regulator, cysteine metabolism repressor